MSQVGGSAVRGFTGVVRVPHTRKRYAYRDPFTWEVGRKGSSLAITIGNINDYDFDVSVPLLLEPIQSPHETPVVIASGVHDWLLENDYDKAFASSEFRRVLRAFGIGSQRAWALYFATLFFTAFKGD